MIVSKVGWAIFSTGLWTKTSNGQEVNIPPKVNDLPKANTAQTQKGQRALWPQNGANSDNFLCIGTKLYCKGRTSKVLKPSVALAQPLTIAEQKVRRLHCQKQFKDFMARIAFGKVGICKFIINCVPGAELSAFQILIYSNTMK